MVVQKRHSLAEITAGFMSQNQITSRNLGFETLRQSLARGLSVAGSTERQRQGVPIVFPGCFLMTRELLNRTLVN